MGKPHFSRSDRDVAHWLGPFPIDRSSVEFSESIVEMAASAFGQVEPSARIDEIVFGTNGAAIGFNGEPANTDLLEGYSYFRLRIRMRLAAGELSRLLCENSEVSESLRDLAIAAFTTCGIEQCVYQSDTRLAELLEVRAKRAQRFVDALISWHNAGRR